ncbi:exoribonuclease R [Vibrio maritimus]|uniref:exoribonuclease R n=1 Tax=Vibrio maritimus TaxID=990268 RepID=UPI0040682E58
MIPDYTFDTLNTMPREELEEFAARMIGRMVPEDVMTELFTFDQEEVDNEERMMASQLDAILRMTAIALSEIQQAFDDSENANQNSERMTRLVLWHFYAVSFNLKKAIPLQTHCNHVEAILANRPQDVLGWVKVLNDLLHTYAGINEGK